jgi:hypothetical protein
MRDAKLKSLVTTLIGETFTGADADVATAILNPADEDAFGILCFRLHEYADGDADTIAVRWREVAKFLDEDDKLDLIVNGFFDSNCAYLSSLVEKV